VSGGGKQWNGGIYPATGRGPFWVKFRRWEDRDKSNPWAKKKGFRTRGDANAFLVDAKREYDEKARGLYVKPVQTARKAPLEELLATFADYLRGGIIQRERKRPEKQIETNLNRLRKAFEWMKVTGLDDLRNAAASLESATRFLNLMLRDRSVIDERCTTANKARGGAAPKTRNDYMAALKQFGSWLEDTERLPRSPFKLLRKLDAKGATKERQVLTWEQVRDAARAAIQRTLQGNARPANKEKHLRSAKQRAMAMLLGFLAGMRRQEVENMRWGWVEADLIEVPALWTKSKVPQCIPLHDGLRGLLKQWRKVRSVELGRPARDGDLVVTEEPEQGQFPGLPEHVAERFRDDCAWAEIEHEPDKLLDLHAMRTSLANALSEAVPDSIVGELLRHESTSVTRRHYRKRDAAKLSPFINEIPAEAADVPGLAAVSRSAATA